MRDWQKGEIKKFGMAAKLLIFLGVSVACVANFDRDLGKGILGGGMSLAGLAFAIYLIRYERRLRKSEAKKTTSTPTESK